MCYQIPGLVTDEDCAEYLVNRGRGWVCESNGEIVGFAIADLDEDNIWALFVKPDFEGLGIGRKLHDTHAGLVFLAGQKKWSGWALPPTRGPLHFIGKPAGKKTACMVRVK